MSGTSDFVGDGSLDDFVDTAVPALQGKNDPAKQDGYYAEASKKYNIPVPILKSLATVESSNGKNLLSPAGAKGMMGIMDGTKPTVGVENSYDPEQAIDGAANYLRQNLDKFGGNYTDALRAYNGGPGFTKLTPDSPGYAENTAYVGKVQRALAAQGVDPNIINQPDAGTKVAAAGGGVSSDSTSTYTPTAKASASPPPPDNSIDDFVDGAIKDLVPPPAAAAAPQIPQQAPALAPQQQAQLAGIIANPPQPDAPPPPPPQTPQPQAAPGPQAPPPVPSPPQAAPAVAPQAPQAVAPPPVAPQDAQIPQPPGATPPPVPSAPPTATAPNVPTSVGPAFETANAMTLGAAKPVIAGIGAGIAGLEGQSVGGTYSANMNALNAGQSAYQAAHPVAAAATNLLAPLPAEVAGGGLIGRAAGALGGFLPEAAQGAIRFLTGMGGTVEAPTAIGALPTGARVAGQGVGNALTNIASKGTAGALQGGGAGLAGSGIDPDNKQSVKTQMLNGTLAGAGLGTALGTVARTVLPAVAPDLAKMALLMKGYGIDLPTGALLGSHALNAAAGPGEQHTLEQGMSAWNRQMGSTADGKITSEIVDKAKSDAGNAIESVANQVGLQTASNPLVRRNFYTGMMQLGQQFQAQINSRTEPAAVPKLIDAFDRMRSMLQNDLPGKAYTEATQTGGWVSNLQNSDIPAVATYGKNIRTLFDQALDQSAAASGNQDAVKTLQAARQHYRVAVNIEPLADRAGAAGIIDPRALANKFAGDLPNTSTKILADGMRYLPSIDRVGNVKNNGGLLGMVARSHALPIVAGLAGGAGGYGIGDIPGAIGGIAAAGGIEKIGEHVLNSPGYRNALLGAPTESKVGALARGALRAIPSTLESGAANLYRSHNPLTQP